jgi:hypothetical protein
MMEEGIDEQKLFDAIDKILPHLYGLTIEQGLAVLITILANALADQGMTAEDATRQFFRGYKAVLCQRKGDDQE